MCMKYLSIKILCLVFCCSLNLAYSQIYINEGSNKNYSTIADENGDFPDWIELYNAGNDTVNLYDYALSDNPTNHTKWTFPNIKLLPGEHKIVFCSAKDRKPFSAFVNVLNETNFNPLVGWNNHTLTTPFYWDGISSLILNTCSYNSNGYSSNSVFNQSVTPYYSTVFAVADGGPSICETQFGSKEALRPNMKINNYVIGTETQQNCNTCYPAPYGNWYWAARNQMVIPAAELAAAGLSAGFITSFAFDVVATDANTVYSYIDCSMKLVSYNQVTTNFEPVDTNGRLHTNFKISTGGETIYLYDAAQTLVSSLLVNCAQPDISVGLFPDASANIALFLNGTPEATNNLSIPFYSYLLPPVISVPAGLYNNPITVSITNPNGAGSSIRYTLNGNDPDSTSSLYSGIPIQIFYSGVLKAKAFSATELNSQAAVASYLFGINHVTPVLSVVTAPHNLFGTTGIFDNWGSDWEKAAYVEYFDTAHQLIFSQNAGIQIDGGWGGSRYLPQHSFRVELDHSILGDGPIFYPLIPNRPARIKYSKFYLRNGSNNYLLLPYKDAAHLECLGAQTNNYYTAWRPVTVYINGAYFGLYELREKYDAEYFKVVDNANPDSLDILSLSAWYAFTLRAVEGSVDSFYTAYNTFNGLNPADTSFWNAADHYFDMLYYNDYIIAETWGGNVDWPGNNIKIYRSNKTNFRWRFCLIDFDLSLNPNGWTTAVSDNIAYVLNADPNNPYVNIFLKSIQNPRFKNYFINRYADLMNTSYQYSRLSSVANSMFMQTVIEMPKEFLRWGDPNNINGQMNDFVNNHQTFLSELAIRTEQVRAHIQSNFTLNGQVLVTLDVYPAGAGKIKISTIIPDSLPWTGVYFDGNPVRLTAIPNPGYTFAYWDSNNVLTNIDSNISIVQNINASTLYNAVFTPIPNGVNTANFNSSVINVYPNPMADKLNVKINNNEPSEINIYDISSRKILQQTFTNTITLNTEQLAKGVYLYEVRSRKGIIKNGKVIKQ